MKNKKLYPLSSRIKKLMQTDEDVGKIAQASPVLIGRALEMFLQKICESAAKVATDRQAKTMQPAHLKACVLADDKLDFLKDIVSQAPDLAADKDGEAPAAKRPRAHECKSEPMSPSSSSRGRPAARSSSPAQLPRIPHVPATTAEAAAPGTQSSTAALHSSDSDALGHSPFGRPVAAPPAAKPLSPTAWSAPRASFGFGRGSSGTTTGGGRGRGRGRTGASKLQRAQQADTKAEPGIGAAAPPAAAAAPPPSPANQAQPQQQPQQQFRCPKPPSSRNSSPEVLPGPLLPKAEPGTGPQATRRNGDNANGASPLSRKRARLEMGGGEGDADEVGWTVCTADEGATAAAPQGGATLASQGSSGHPAMPGTHPDAASGAQLSEAGPQPDSAAVLPDLPPMLPGQYVASFAAHEEDDYDED